MPSTLGQRVRQLRTELGMSQAELGAAAGVSVSYVSLIEVGKRIPARDVLAGIAKRLGTSVHYLETGSEPDDVHGERLQLAAASLAAAGSEPDQARDQYRQLSCSAHREIANKALWALAALEENYTDFDAALSCLDALDRPCREHEPGAPSALALQLMYCRIYQAVGDYARSAETGEAGMQEFAALGLTGAAEELRLASTMVATYEARGDLASARRLAARVIADAEALGNPEELSRVYRAACQVSADRGDLPLALECADKALAVLSDEREGVELAGFRVTCAWLLLRLSPPKIEEADAHLAAASSVLQKAAAIGVLARCEMEMARSALMRGHAASAIDLADSAVGHFTAASDNPGEHRGRVVRGLCMIAAGLPDQGIAAVEAAVAALRERLPMEAARACRDLGEFLLARGNVDQAVNALRMAADIAGVRSATAAMPAAPAYPGGSLPVVAV
jgi:transcriptional regulator with XRE-family HTH domain